MKCYSREWYEMLEQFEKDLDRAKIYGRKDREKKELWARGIVYQSGEVNQMFRGYQLGYSFANSINIQQQ